MIWNKTPESALEPNGLDLQSHGQGGKNLEQVDTRLKAMVLK